VKDNRFVFVIPAFNARETVQQMIMSVIVQSYGLWRIIFRDDMSTDGTGEFVKAFARSLGLTDRISVTLNTQKHWEVQNIVESLKECDEDEIVCRLDADDWLCDVDALAIINMLYKEKGVGALWTSHRWSFSNYNISGPLPREADPYVHPWVSSHLKTFRKSLISGVKDENFRGPDGQYYKRIGDQAIYLPVLHQAAGRWHWENITAYHYTIDMRPETFQTEDAKFQKSEAEHLRRRGFVQ
jgi:glycosyltransferase involved in cell wall biosynthesis